jgi:hypothetical protein
MFRRCQRQYYFSHIAARHKAKDSIRKEAFILKQIKDPSTWQGLVIHQGIKLFVVPALQAHAPLDWSKISDQTIEVAKRQFAFSAARQYRMEGATKSGSNGEYCALAPHERGEEIPLSKLEEICENIQKSFKNLSGMDEFLAELQRRPYYQAEIPLHAQFDNVTVEIVPDLIFSRGFGFPSVVDWKVERDSTGGSHQLQMDLYAWVFCHHPKWGVKQPEDIEMYEVQLLKGRVRRLSFSSEKFTEVEDTIYRSIHEIQALCGNHKYENQVLSNYRYANSPNSCAYCSFHPLCKELRNEQTLDDIVPDSEPERSQYSLSFG